jgi:hypothetical protein
VYVRDQAIRRAAALDVSQNRASPIDPKRKKKREKGEMLARISVSYDPAQYSVVEKVYLCIETASGNSTASADASSMTLRMSSALHASQSVVGTGDDEQKSNAGDGQSLKWIECKTGLVVVPLGSGESDGKDMSKDQNPS